MGTELRKLTGRTEVLKRDNARVRRKRNKTSQTNEKQQKAAVEFPPAALLRDALGCRCGRRCSAARYCEALAAGAGALCSASLALAHSWPPPASHSWKPAAKAPLLLKLRPPPFFLCVVFSLLKPKPKNSKVCHRGLLRHSINNI